MPLWNDDSRPVVSQDPCPTGTWNAVLKNVMLDQAADPNKLSVVYTVTANEKQYDVWSNFIFSEAAMGVITGHFKPIGAMNAVIGKDVSMDQAALLIYNWCDEMKGKLNVQVKITHRMHNGRTYANVYPKFPLANIAPVPNLAPPVSRVDIANGLDEDKIPF